MPKPTTKPKAVTSALKSEPKSRSGWTFLTNHAHVLMCLAAEPKLRVREIADKVGITERAVMAILADLESGGVLVRKRVGRTNHYTIHLDTRLRHPIEAHRSIGDLIQMIVAEK
jgi:DNA-binding MarR family transcriptional regulator